MFVQRRGQIIYYLVDNSGSASHLSRSSFGCSLLLCSHVKTFCLRPGGRGREEIGTGSCIERGRCTAIVIEIEIVIEIAIEIEI